MKNEIEKKFDVLLDAYFAEFGKNYPLDITDTRPIEEHIESIETALKSKKEIPEEKSIPDVTY